MTARPSDRCVHKWNHVSLKLVAERWVNKCAPVTMPKLTEVDTRYAVLESLCICSTEQSRQPGSDMCMTHAGAITVKVTMNLHGGGGGGGGFGGAPAHTAGHAVGHQQVSSLGFIWCCSRSRFRVPTSKACLLTSAHDARHRRPACKAKPSMHAASCSHDARGSGCHMQQHVVMLHG